MQAYQRAYQMIQRLDTEPVHRTPGERLPVFSLEFNTLDASETHDNLQVGGVSNLRIPLVTQLRNPQSWRERLIPLAHSWYQRTHRSFPERLRFAETIA